MLKKFSQMKERSVRERKWKQERMIKMDRGSSEELEKVVAVGKREGRGSTRIV